MSSITGKSTKKPKVQFLSFTLPTSSLLLPAFSHHYNKEGKIVIKLSLLSNYVALQPTMGGGEQKKQATALMGWRPYRKAEGTPGMRTGAVAGTTSVATNIHSPYFFTEYLHSGTWLPRIKTISLVSFSQKWPVDLVLAKEDVKRKYGSTSWPYP